MMRERPLRSLGTGGGISAGACIVIILSRAGLCVANYTPSSFCRADQSPVRTVLQSLQCDARLHHASQSDAGNGRLPVGSRSVLVIGSWPTPSGRQFSTNPASRRTSTFHERRSASLPLHRSNARPCVPTGGCAAIMTLVTHIWLYGRIVRLSRGWTNL